MGKSPHSQAARSWLASRGVPEGACRYLRPQNGSPVVGLLAVLFVAITGAGKTTVVHALVGHGFTRLSVDEEVHRLQGRYGVDYPRHAYFEREHPVVEAIRERFIKELQAGNDVVLDHGLWRREDREAWKEAAREAGGLPAVVYLPANRDELLRRLAERNEREDATPSPSPRSLR